MLKIFVFVLASAHILHCYQLSKNDDCNALGSKGKCILLKNCYSLRESLKTTPRQRRIVFEMIRKLQCGFVGHQSKVCCPIEALPGNKYISYDIIETINNALLYTPSDVRKHKNLNLLPANCGNFPPITDEKMKNNDFPWTVQLIYSSDKPLRFGCGGSIINNEHILTAAHCVTNLKYNRLVGVRLGNYQNVADYNCWKTKDNHQKHCALSDDIENRNIKYTIVHPGYRTNSMQNDIAIIKLDSPVDFGDTLSKYPICLPWYPELRNFQFDESKITISGVGMLVSNETYVDRNIECVEKAKSYIPIAVYCPSRNGDPTNSKYVQDGILSINKKKCGKNGMFVYTKITNHLTWILDNLDPVYFNF